ncbi:MAG: hypothetical protein GC203_19835 [Phenylobacterium sp.]|nr:hypothetical protein [Phenylobacterium sp.]
MRNPTVCFRPIEPGRAGKLKRRPPPPALRATSPASQGRSRILLLPRATGEVDRRVATRRRGRSATRADCAGGVGAGQEQHAPDRPGQRPAQAAAQRAGTDLGFVVGGVVEDGHEGLSDLMPRP